MNSLQVKRLIGRICSQLPIKKPRRVVLLYHAVGLGQDACPTELFAAQMEYISSNTKVMSLEEILCSRSVDPVQTAVTFDDGYLSVFKEAFPIMERNGIPGSVYVNTGSIAADDAGRKNSDALLGHLSSEKFMLWSELSALQDAGWVVGSHGVDHVNMTSLDDEVLRFQLEESRLSIEKSLDCTCDTFAFPWGLNCTKSRAAVKAAGYRHAAGTIHGAIQSEAEDLAFQRIDIRQDYSLQDFISVVNGDWDFLGPIQKFKSRWR